MAAAADLIALVAAVVAIGVIAQILSDRFRVPSVVFLIGAGIALGPEALGLLDPDAFGGGLPAIVGLSVAIIVFEGAFHIHLDDLRAAPAPSVRLVTVGALIALVGTAVAVRYAIPGADWPLSLLIGALLVATGPTVITPILDVVPVRDRVATALETEGIVNDVTAAILAVVIFKAIVNDYSNPGELVELFASRLGTGVAVGLVVAAAVYVVLTRVDLSPGNAPRNARLLTLAGALVAYGGAESVFTEAGIAAAATAGVVLGNLDLPYEEDVSQFKGDVTLIVLSFVFVILAALLDVDVLLSLGLGGVAVVAAVTLVIRPALVFASTVGDRFTTGEKLFMSSVAPRGIIPASVATLFAVQLRSPPLGMTAEADVLVGVVFLVILTTVVVEGGFARRIAEHLDVIPMRALIIGGGSVGRSLAERLEDRGENVVLIEADETAAERARDAGHTVHVGDATDSDVLRSAGAENAGVLVAATGDDDVNLLVAQLARSKFGVESVLARATDPDNVAAFEELDVHTISSTEATAWALDNAIERPALADWMTELGRSGDVQEVEVTATDIVGRTVGDVSADLPEACLIALVTRDGESVVPAADHTLQAGDHLTLIGERDAVREAMAVTHPES